MSSGATTEGSIRYRLSRALETHVLRRADAVTTICEGLRREVTERGIPAERVAVIPNSVDVESFARLPGGGAAFRVRYGIEGKFVLGFIGSFFAWEGLTLLIESLRDVVRARPDVRLLLVGGGIEEPAIRAAVERHELSDFVVFTGQLPHQDVSAAYAAVDVLVYPRTPIRLTQMVTPLKPLEAMALGKPLIASDVGGHRELIRDGITGKLFAAGSAEALARTVLAVVGDAKLRESMAVAGARFVRTERTWTKAVAGYEPVYRRLLDPVRAPAMERS